MSGDGPPADEWLQVTADGGAAEARLWWRSVPTLPGERAGIVGGFRATSETAARAVLARAAAALRAQGCTCAIGPMDGSTWRSYRFVTEPGTAPPFLLEPAHPPEWPRWWEAAGFAPLARYYSTLTPDLVARDQRTERAGARLRAAGVTIRTVDLARFDAELAAVHAVALAAFADNFLYTPLPPAEFVAQYQAARAHLRREFLLLAEQAGRPVGFVFALPDLLQAQRGEPVSTVIVKTLAVRPGREYAGLGAVLLAEVHAAARRLGFRQAIHAMMHARNVSRNLSARYARTIRGYALYARALENP